jgi:hypothetical protein
MPSHSPENTAARGTASRPNLLALISRLERASASIPFWWGICLGCAAILALAARQSMNPDGLSYLDLATEALHSGPSALVNAYWSPGYPALLSLALALVRPSPGQEFPLVHLVNFCVFALTLWGFHFFLRRWLSHMDAFGSIGDQAKKYVVPFAFCAFLWFTLEYVGVDGVTPDLCLAAVVFFAAGITCRLSLPGSSSKHYVALGLVFGLGYYVKAAMLPLALMFLCGLLLFSPSRGVTRLRLLISLSVFVLVASPLVAALSGRVGKLSFGEAGRLNYAWYVQGLQRSTGWTGDSSGVYGTPEHPPRRFMERPLVLEFESPIMGTVPLWYDPSYWYAGATVRFDLHQQTAALERALRDYRFIFRHSLVFFAGAAVLWILAAREKRSSQLSLCQWWLFFWPLTAMLMYAIVHVESRFIGSFCVLLCLAMYGPPMFRLNGRIAAAVCATVISTIMISFGDHLLLASARTLKDLAGSTQPDYQKVAVGLRSVGVRSGDRLAVVGDPVYAYYARYAGLHVVVEIAATDEFWNLRPLELRSVAERLARIGVKAIVAENRPDVSAPGGWLDMKVSDSERYSILVLPQPQPAIR